MCTWHLGIICAYSPTESGCGRWWWPSPAKILELRAGNMLFQFSLLNFLPFLSLLQETWALERSSWAPLPMPSYAAILCSILDTCTYIHTLYICTYTCPHTLCLCIYTYAHTHFFPSNTFSAVSWRSCITLHVLHDYSIFGYKFRQLIIFQMLIRGVT